MSASDVEIDRVLNAVGTTLNDQRAAAVEPERLQAIADGATGRQRRLRVRRLTPHSFAFDDAETRTHVASAERSPDGTWTVRREREAEGSGVALPEGGG